MGCHRSCCTRDRGYCQCTGCSAELCHPYSYEGVRTRTCQQWKARKHWNFKGGQQCCSYCRDQHFQQPVKETSGTLAVAYEVPTAYIAFSSVRADVPLHGEDVPPPPPISPPRAATSRDISTIAARLEVPETRFRQRADLLDMKLSEVLAVLKAFKQRS